MTVLDRLPPVVFSTGGLVCSLGLNVDTACAALRGGFVRPSTVDTFMVGNIDDSGGAIVHAVPFITHGLDEEARLIRLMQAALEDLQLQHPEAPWENARTGFYLSMPDPDRVHTGHDLISDDALREQEMNRFKQVQAERSAPVDAKDKAQHLLKKSAKLAGWTSPANLQRASIAGHTGVAELTKLAWHDIESEIVELAIVGGVDSWVDESSLLWLERRKRLKSPTMPVGLPPGEAAGFLLMERDHRAKARNAASLAVLQSVTLEQEIHPHLAAEASTGKALSKTLFRSAELAGWSSGRSPWLVVDQNGEPYRAMEWGHALSYLVQEHFAFKQPTLWYPVASVGDTGAASGVVQASMAIQAFVRNYSPARNVALLSSAEAGQRACIMLGAGIG